MADVASRELRNNTRGVIERAEAGEEIWITVDGRRTVQLIPQGRGQRWLPKAQVIEIIERSSADPGLRDLLAELNDSTTDDEW